MSVDFLYPHFINFVN